MKTTPEQWATAIQWAEKMKIQYGAEKGKEFAEYLALNCYTAHIRQLYAMTYLVLCMERELETNGNLITEFL